MTGTQLGPGPNKQRAQTLQAVCRHLESIAARQPVLAVLEDAHWSDPTTLELFDLIVDRAEHLPILLLITFRPEFAPSWSSRGHAMYLTLDRLDRAEAAALVKGDRGQQNVVGGAGRAAGRPDGRRPAVRRGAHQGCSRSGRSAPAGRIDALAGDPRDSAGLAACPT